MSKRTFLLVVLVPLGLGLAGLGVWLAVLATRGPGLPAGVHVIDLRQSGQIVPKKAKGQRIIVIGKCGSLLPGTLVVVGTGHMFQCRMRDGQPQPAEDEMRAIEGEMDVAEGWPGMDAPLIDGFIGVPLKDCVVLPYRP